MRNYYARSSKQKQPATRETADNSRYWLGNREWLGRTYCQVSHGNSTLWASIKFIFRRRDHHEKVGNC